MVYSQLIWCQLAGVDLEEGPLYKRVCCCCWL